jgi:nitrate reductase NapE component
LSLRYLENHRTLGKELNRINRRSKNAKKSVAGILMMIIPLLALLIVGGYPWFVFSMKAIDNVPI